MRIHIHYYECTLFFIYPPSVPITDVDLHKKYDKFYIMLCCKGAGTFIYYIF